MGVSDIRHTQFDSQSSQAAINKREADKKRKAAEKRAEFLLRKRLGAAMGAELPREGLADEAFSAARRVVLDILTGAIPIQNGAQAAQVVKAMVEVGRLEKGEATYIPMDPEQAKENIKALKAELQRRGPELVDHG